MKQIEIHHKIDLLVAQSTSDISRDEIFEVIFKNSDAKDYFYSKVDASWISWLWENDFLKSLVELNYSTNQYYQSPESAYLIRSTTKEPEKATSIILNITGTLNTTLISVLLSACTNLPADQIARVIRKIKKEKWIQFTDKFHDWSFEFEKILEILVNAGDYSSFLALAEEVLSPRIQYNQKDQPNFDIHHPFHLKDLSSSKIFEYLQKVSSGALEPALETVSGALGALILLGEKTGGDFKIKDNLYLYDTDFFLLEPSQRIHISSRDDVRELIASLKFLFQRGLDLYKNDPKKQNDLYIKYIDSIPENKSIYRFKLSILGLNVDLFKEEIKRAIFRVFESQSPWDLTSGAEYARLLQSSFGDLTQEDQKAYISYILSNFIEDKYLLSSGNKILSSIHKYLDESQIEQIERVFGKLQINYIPEPLVKMGRGGIVTPQAPEKVINWNGNIVDIINVLKKECSPDKLETEFINDDFLHPVNAEGVGNKLKSEILRRPEDYIISASLFFDRENLHSHYTYSYLYGVSESLKKSDEKNDLTKILRLMVSIKESGINDPFKESVSKRDASGWLAGWDAVHGIMADLAKELLSEKNHLTNDFFIKNRKDFLEVIEYLLNHHDPSPKDELAETAKIKTKLPNEEEYSASDPYTTAINSVRGKAFQAFLGFVFNDSKLLDPKGKQLSEDVKSLYQRTIEKEPTQAIMFLFGHSLPFFFFRDTPWLKGKLGIIFNQEPNRENLRIATWEGYLANNLYKEIFFDPYFQKLYSEAIKKDPLAYPKRRYFLDPSEGLANHIALALVHYDEFNFDHPLFKEFLSKSDSKVLAEFISFIGRMYISGSNSDANKAVRTDLAKKKLKDLWDWSIDHHKDEVLVQFEYWMNNEKHIFDVPWLADHILKTLQKTNGYMDWDYNLIKLMREITNTQTETALKITHLYLLGAKPEKAQRSVFVYTDEWLEVFKVLYKDPKTKAGTIDLINDLLETYGRPYWKLKEVLEDALS